ncbi:3-isopropylmalate dehydratase small subunit [Acaryochloris sp. CCMEE 5410]|uniref:3-isopropylmalate dehydratase small subunit n=1 Tax=Acaryochloris sp. CCMEE 5410 TaxID=310037 RepID=UPI000248480C|nr:3-isopropylmalate dehydratase small subunit [Acaryochloris sp. CCMEE 5410]KAI9131085.1 3-isopropylmalate dehydratase small subunit [Acaryochloris sp. CCMEE 5410]
MSQIHSHTGAGIPLTGNDIDTDRIIPARFLRCVTFDSLGQQVFADDRQQTGGQHPFDLPQFQGATVLVVNGNFGCGSSREHAPQAISKWGIQAIIGESFAEIFFGNCVAIGIPCVTAAADVVQQLQSHLNEHPGTSVQINLDQMTVTWGDVSHPIHMGEGPRQMMLSGTWDACGQLLGQVKQIEATTKRLPYLAWS